MRVSAMFSKIFLLLLVFASVSSIAVADGLQNGDFEDGSKDAPSFWRIYTCPGAVAKWEESGGMDNSRCVSITVNEPSNGEGVIWEQEVQLEPYTAYLLKGYIKGADIKLADENGKETGASVATSMWLCDTIRLKSGDKAVGTFDWKPFVIDFMTGPDGKSTIMCKFGRGGMTGKAWFDNISVYPNPDVEKFESEHFVINLYKDEVEAATPQGVRWQLANVDKTYEAFKELTGYEPGKEKSSAWGPRLWNMEALGWSGNPLLWTPDKKWMSECWTKEEYCAEVFLHELAHNFDIDEWTFDAHFNELKFYYACETRDLAIMEEGYKRGKDTRGRWIERTRNSSVPDPTVMVRKCITLVDEIGWEPFKKTFRSYLGASKYEPIPGKYLATWPEGKPGGITRLVWTGISGGEISDLTSSARFKEEPDQIITLENFDIPIDGADGYGDKICGFVIPPETGDYTFWVSSDDSSELWLSTNDKPENKVKIAWLNGYCSPKTIAQPTQQSDRVHLEKGEKYYIEVLHKEGGGGDHLSVSWSTKDSDRISEDQLKQRFSRWGKFESFFNYLSTYSGYDAWSIFTPEEIEIIKWSYTKDATKPTASPAELPEGTKTAWLSDLKWELARVGWAQPERDSADGMPLKCIDKWHKKGIYAHAPSLVVFNLDGKWKTLETSCGLYNGRKGSVVFVIKGDGKELYRSDKVMEQVELETKVDVSGVDTLELIVENAGDGSSSDWGIWLSPKLSR